MVLSVQLGPALTAPQNRVSNPDQHGQTKYNNFGLLLASPEVFDLDLNWVIFYKKWVIGLCVFYSVDCTMYVPD